MSIRLFVFIMYFYNDAQCTPHPHLDASQSWFCSRSITISTDYIKYYRILRLNSFKKLKTQKRKDRTIQIIYYQHHGALNNSRASPLTIPLIATTTIIKTHNDWFRNTKPTVKSRLWSKYVTGWNTMHIILVFIITGFNQHDWCFSFSKTWAVKMTYGSTYTEFGAVAMF